MIQITPNFALGDDEFTERMVKASGPGGQHVNKTSNAVELRFDVGASTLPDDAKDRLRRLSGICEDGETAVLVTRFTESHNWRPNRVLDGILRNTGAAVVTIEPSGAVIDHFLLNKHWDRCRLEIRRAKTTAKAAIASGQTPRSFGSGKINKVISDRFYEYLAARLNDVNSTDNAMIANRFNSLNLYTLRGHKWDADAVRSLRATLDRRSG